MKSKISIKKCNCIHCQEKQEQINKIIFGLIKVASSEVEEIDVIRDRLLSCLNHIDKERLIAAPDCGLGYLSRDMAMIKLKNLSKAAKSI